MKNAPDVLAETLEPCPLCDSHAILNRIERDDDCAAPRPHNWYRIECSNCEVALERESPRWFMDSRGPETAEDLATKAEVIAAWNRRALSAPIAPAGPDDAFPTPSRKDGGEPCGECHIQPGETCDICGAQNSSPVLPSEALAKPLFWVSEKQVPACIGTYLPTRAEREGLFQMPVYAAPPVPSEALESDPICTKCASKEPGSTLSDICTCGDYPPPSEALDACKACEGTGTGPDYAGDDMRCVEAPCWRCDGTGKAFGAIMLVSH